MRKSASSTAGGPSSASTQYSWPAYDGEDFDTPPETVKESEAEIHLKSILRKQLDTNTSLEKELSKEKKEFAVSSLLIEDEENRVGVKTLREFQKAKEEDSELVKLRDYGLTDEEVILKLKSEGGQIPKLTKRPRYGESADSEQRKIRVIEAKVETHEHLLRTRDEFSNTKEMTRREMEIEASLHRGTEKADKFSHLVKLRQNKYPSNDPVLLTLKEYEETKNPQREDFSDNEESEEDNGAFVGPILAPIHIRVKPLDERIVQGRKLDTEQLKAIPKFKDYEPGVPSKTLFVKNLGKNIGVEDLAALFVRFENVANPEMDYKVMKGRMRGQAFVTFPDEKSAVEALEFANGYLLNDKPIVISFGKRKEEK